MNLAELLYEAAASEHGKIVLTSDPEALRQRLYKYRRDNPLEEFANLSFIPSPTNPNAELWIVKRTPGHAKEE